MKTLTRVAEMQLAAAGARGMGRRIGFVPTMGALHEGHVSLVRASKQRADLTVVSIFVNPAQFGPGEDYRSYPRDRAADSTLLIREGVDILFAPDAEDIYPPDFQTSVSVEQLSEPLCGHFRPGHFRGVATVVLKLFNIVSPDVACFGRKDPQQSIIIQRLVRDLNLPVEVVVCPIIREPDGLAMSSRNAYLSPEERRAALVLHRSLERARKLLLGGERRAGVIVGEVRKLVEAEPRARIDYIEAVDAATLAPLALISSRALIAFGVWIGATRLVDNLLIELSDDQVTLEL